MEEKLYLCPVWLRIWHTTNGLFFLILLVTGLSLQYASVDFTIIQFNIAVSTHNIAGVVLSVSYLVFLSGNIFTKNGKYYKIRLHTIVFELIKQFRYYIWGIFRHEKSPFPVNLERKFNPLQKGKLCGCHIHFHANFNH